MAIHCTRARRWVGGAWRDLEATVVDLSSHGLGVSVNLEARVGDRLSLAIPLQQGAADLKVTIEIRHIRRDARFESTWRAGGLFRNMPPSDYARVARFLDAGFSARA